MEVIKELFLVYLVFSVAATENNLDIENYGNFFSYGNYSRTKTVNGFNLKKLETFNDEFRSISIDSILTVPELFKKYGYPSETHTIETADGYLLEMHRIPQEGKIPVLLLHGILDSSAGWVIMGPNKSLAYILYDLGYDVWLGNCRGNTYGKNHVYYNTNSNKFWDFSFHELGIFDLPSMFDHITKITNYEKIHYIGHSQATTSFFIMCQYREGYCNRVLSVNALSPVAYLKNMRSPLVKGLAKIANSLAFVGSIFGLKDILPSNDVMKIGAQAICKKEAITQALCVNLIFVVTGYDSEQLNKTMLPIIMSHIPAGSSVKQLIHYAQLVNSGRFQMYDYGFIKNLIIYGHIRPPLYDLSKVTATINIHYSMNDWVSDEKDVHRLIKDLPNVGEVHLIPLPKFNHMDFLLAIDAKKLVYDEVIKIMKASEK